MPEKHQGSALQFFTRSTRNPGQRVGNHHHECLELVYYPKSGGTTIIDSIPYRWQDHSLGIIFKGITHSDYYERETEVLFLGLDINHPGLKPLESHTLLQNGLIHIDAEGPVPKLFYQLETEITSGKAFQATMIDALSSLLLISVIRGSTTPGKRQINFSRVIGYIEEHYPEDITAEYLAKLSGFSYHRFRHLFRENYGMPPNQYIIDLRLKKSAALLKESDCTIAEAAQQTGFSSESYYSLMFKRKFGETPGSYRQAFKYSTT